MRVPAARLTIRSLMGAIVVVAGGLALSRWGGWPLLVVVSVDLIPAAVLWRALRGFRRLAAWGFGVLAVLANIACAFLGVYQMNWGGGLLMLLGWFLTFPLMLGLGAAWATESTRREAVPRRSPLLAWPMVLAPAFLPLATPMTAWPLRLAFLASRPSLDRLADRVAGGSAPGFPTRAGVFSVVGSAVDLPSGSVGLVIDPDPSGRSGFVRVPLGAEGRRAGPFTNLNLDLTLGDGWRYECED